VKSTEHSANHSAGLHAVDELCCTLSCRLWSRLTSLWITHRNTIICGNGGCRW